MLPAFRVAALSLGALLLCPLPTHLGAQQPSFSLEQVLGAPFIEGLSAAPAGGAVAWISIARGTRNVWVATPPDYHGRQLTSFAADDGQEITGLTWTPNGRAVLFVRGGERNRAGEWPNPAHLGDSVGEAIWFARLGRDSARKVADGHDPAVSPKGDQLAFVRDGQIWAMALPPAAKPEPAQLARTRGTAATLRWSPDGSRLAFVSARERHSFIGIYDYSAKAIRFLDPSVDRDVHPVWAPDGSRIAFVRLPAFTDDMRFIPRRAGEPWSIRVADVATGVGREVWRARRGVGSVFQPVVADDQLFWGQGDRIVFPWEGDGWTHLYSVTAKGGSATLLTPGAFEVEHVAPGANRLEVVYSSNQDDVDRRHVWRIGLAGDPTPVALTWGKGIEWGAVLASDGKTIVTLHADTRRPARPALITAPGVLRDLVPEAIPADFPADALVEPEQVVLQAADGLPVHAQLFRPRSHQPGERHPALLFLHGGPIRQMLLGYHYMGYYSNSYAMNQYLANRGYLVLAVNYRTGIGHGMRFREARQSGAAGASEFQDVVAAGRWLRARSDVDPRRIGLWGGSYGGYLTALGLARASDLFAAGVDLHGVHDWNRAIKVFSPAYDSLTDAARARVAYAASPLAVVNTWRSPVLLISGDDDRNVSFTESVYLAEALRKRGVSVEQLVIPDEVHDFLLHRTWLTVYAATAEFLDRKLRSSRLTAND